MPLRLPTELWYYVASFIPDENLQELYSVNCAFFDLAMRLRYQTIFILSFHAARPPPPRLINVFSFKRLLAYNPAMLGRFVERIVCQLFMDIWDKASFTGQPFVRSSKPLAAVYNACRRKLVKGPIGKRQIKKALEIISLYFIHLKEINLDTYNTKSRHWIPAFTSEFNTLAIWRNLRALTLKYHHSEGFLQDYVVKPVDLPNLKSLSIEFRIQRPMHERATEVMITAVQFINALSPQLEALSIAIQMKVWGHHPVEEDQKIPAFKQCPNLRSFSYLENSWIAHPDVSKFLVFRMLMIEEFLRIQSDTVAELYLDFNLRGYDDLLSGSHTKQLFKDLGRVRFGRLESLHIGIPMQHLQTIQTLLASLAAAEQVDVYDGLKHLSVRVTDMDQDHNYIELLLPWIASLNSLNRLSMQLSPQDFDTMQKLLK